MCSTASSVPDQFEALRRGGGLLEAFEVFGRSYGTPRAAVEEHLAAGQDVLLEIDVQGALAVREEFPDARCWCSSGRRHGRSSAGAWSSVGRTTRPRSNVASPPPRPRRRTRASSTPWW